MAVELEFTLKSLRFDEDYRPADNTRATTNFANLARGNNRQENLRNALRMIDNRFNALAHWDNARGDRYSIELDIISVEMSLGLEGHSEAFPLIEILKTTVVDQTTSERIEGMVGNNFSSYVRDYDFSILLREHNRNQASFSVPDNFGNLHGNLFKCFLNSKAYKANFNKSPVICLSASSSKTYYRTDNRHPVLGVEYRQGECSSTDQYFSKMGLKVRYFMPQDSVAPLAFYFLGDLCGDYTNLELISTISTMESFQRIYRPEIYNANSAAGAHYRPSLEHQDYSLTQIVYDREERSRLAVEQGRFAEEHFIKPYQPLLEQWSATYAA
ncbi:DUF1852 domain-containing protein [Asticcacaulis sp. BYS171W]|uniref:DUF1852 domain-containing protein n=1 Tax=Asticcacaulis aquaticus TaxID=2984212 RepID=A0ABT5HXS9_9CAUL|nr:DUF1852 domain-containing protein [Asticcacaulis aquaticus]MDC7684261.1 DUF1852 domain-containing protein [Asticcacaulis aquaticus]